MNINEIKTNLANFPALLNNNAIAKAVQTLGQAYLHLLQSNDPIFAQQALTRHLNDLNRQLDKLSDRKNFTHKSSVFKSYFEILDCLAIFELKPNALLYCLNDEIIQQLYFAFDKKRDTETNPNFVERQNLARLTDVLFKIEATSEVIAYFNNPTLWRFLGVDSDIFFKLTNPSLSETTKQIYIRYIAEILNQDENKPDERYSGMRLNRYFIDFLLDSPLAGYIFQFPELQACFNKSRVLCRQWETVRITELDITQDFIRNVSNNIQNKTEDEIYSALYEFAKERLLVEDNIELDLNLSTLSEIFKRITPLAEQCAVFYRQALGQTDNVDWNSERFSQLFNDVFEPILIQAFNNNKNSKGLLEMQDILTELNEVVEVAIEHIDANFYYRCYSFVGIEHKTVVNLLSQFNLIVEQIYNDTKDLSPQETIKRLEKIDLNQYAFNELITPFSYNVGLYLSDNSFTFTAYLEQLKDKISPYWDSETDSTRTAELDYQKEQQLKINLLNELGLMM